MFKIPDNVSKFDNVYDVLKYENLVASKAAIEKIEEVFE